MRLPATAPKRSLLVGVVIGMILSLTTVAVAATSTGNDVSALAKAESQVVGVLKSTRTLARGRRSSRQQYLGRSPTWRR